MCLISAAVRHDDADAGRTRWSNRQSVGNRSVRPHAGARETPGRSRDTASRSSCRPMRRTTRSRNTVFDLGFSQFGVMFFADPVAAFRNIRRALKKHGRLVFACWRSPAEHTWSSVPESAAKPFLPAAPPVDPDAPGRFSLRQPDRIKQVLSGAGFYGIEIQKQDARTFAGATPEEAAASVD